MIPLSHVVLLHFSAGAMKIKCDYDINDIGESEII